jgi:hypothetical protein
MFLTSFISFTAPFISLSSFCKILSFVAIELLSWINSLFATMTLSFEEFASSIKTSY